MDTEISFANTGVLTKREHDEAQLFRSSEDELDRTAFLKLLTTQLQNQNPLDPMKNEAFVAQLAQFSQLEGITNMSTSLSDVADVIRSDRILSGSNLIGKSVFANSGQIETDGSTPSTLEIDLPYGADQVSVGIYNPVTGAQIRSLVVGPQGSGSLTMAWDGRRTDGERAAAGTYLIKAESIIAGQSIPTVPGTYSRVNTVSWDAANTDLTLNLVGNISVPMSKVSRIGEPQKQALSNQPNNKVSGE